MTSEIVIGLERSESSKQVTNGELREILRFTLEQQNHVLFAKPNIVCRGSYSGRNIIASNSDPEKDVDERGYFPVERWILSKTVAENEKSKLNEGLSFLVLRKQDPSTTEKKRKSIDPELYLASFRDAVAVDETLLLAQFAQKWPLTKILDIGGRPVKPSFGTEQNDVPEEVPPIPAHVHYGNIHNGKACGPGKKEAYFFPPVNVAPYKANFGSVITRLGVKPDVSKDEFQVGLAHFGKDDRMYSLLNVYPIQSYDGWTILPGVIHAPGPWLTFEIQRPQDDFNLCSWKLGQQIHDEKERDQAKHAFQLKGLPSEKEFIEEVVPWELTTTPNFKEKYYRPSKVLEEGDWGRRIQLFFDGFYGEGFEVKAGRRFVRQEDSKPYAGVVWSGTGSINSNRVDCQDNYKNEFLVVPHTVLTVEADSKSDLLLYVVFPLEE